MKDLTYYFPSPGKSGGKTPSSPPIINNANDTQKSESKKRKTDVRKLSTKKAPKQLENQIDLTIEAEICSKENYSSDSNSTKQSDKTSDVILKDNNQTKQVESTPKRNAFQFMMESSRKSIGQNSEGKDPKPSEERPEMSKEKKKALTQRKAELEEWANKKGAKKRQIEYEQKGNTISNKLDKRAKRMKKLLKFEVPNEDFIETKRKRLKVLQTDSEDSQNCIEEMIVVEDSNDEAPEKKKKHKLKSSEEKPSSPFKSPWKMKIRLNVPCLEEDAVSSLDLHGRPDSSEDLLAPESRPMPRKLAEVFTKSLPKPKPDPAVLEARRNFLHGENPNSSKNKPNNTIVPELEVFPTISHVKCKYDEEHLPYLQASSHKLNLTLFERYAPENVNVENFKTLNETHKPPETTIDLSPINKPLDNLSSCLQTIKEQNPNYPVLKCFRFLKQKHSPIVKKAETLIEVKKVTKKKRLSKNKRKTETKETVPETCQNADGLLWTDKYKPAFFDEIFGNRRSALELYKWLKTWLEFSEEINSLRKKRKRTDSGGSSSEFETTDDDSNLFEKLPGNTIVLVGPPGTGKTCVLYGLCQELNINVLELNASSKRTGKRLLQELQEATQSHQVQKQDQLDSFLQISQPEVVQQEQKSTKMSLLLVEDVDVVFEQDDGFLSALNQLLTISKRPVVLTTTDPDSVLLQKLVPNHKNVFFKPLTSKIVGPYLQVLCLLEGAFVDAKSVKELLEYNRGDLRTTLSELQYWVVSGGNRNKKTLKQSSTIPKVDEQDPELICDDDSRCSLLEKKEETQTTTEPVHYNCLESFVEFSNAFSKNSLTRPLDLDNVYCHLSRFVTHEEQNALEESKRLDKKQMNHLRSALEMMDSLSVVDVALNKFRIEDNSTYLRPFWRSLPKDSLELKEDVQTASWNRELVLDWTHHLVENSLDALAVSAGCEARVDFSAPSLEEKTIRTKRNNCMLSLLVPVPVSNHLDRRSLCVDYFPALRTICRSEAVRSVMNSKRKNRFYHYVNGLGVDCSEANLNCLCRTFEVS